jgi:hypothetical protein
VFRFTHGLSFSEEFNGPGNNGIPVDRDLDGAWDGDERQAHTNPADPDSKP